MDWIRSPFHMHLFQRLSIGFFSENQTSDFPWVEADHFHVHVFPSMVWSRDHWGWGVSHRFMPSNDSWTVSYHVSDGVNGPTCEQAPAGGGSIPTKTAEACKDMRCHCLELPRCYFCLILLAKASPRPCEYGFQLTQRRSLSPKFLIPVPRESGCW